METRRSEGDSPSSKFLNSLTQFEAGGRGLAMAVAQDAPVPPSEARPIGGASEAVEWFTERLSRKGAPPSMLFLVGAPGNGKSYLLSKVLDKCPSDGQASVDVRGFVIQSTDSGLPLAVVNDASAPAAGIEQGKSLRHDVISALTRPSHLHVNVNRGVFYQELRAEQPDDPVTSLFTWLSSDGSYQGDQYLEPEVTGELSSVRCAQIKVGGTDEGLRVDVVAVYMDLFSILEIQPAYELRTKGKWTGFPGLKDGEKYKIIAPKSPRRRDRGHWESTPAGQLVARAVAVGLSSLTSEPQPLDVVRQNLVALKSDEVFCGFLSVLRNTELATSQHISFRELWTAIAYVIIGDGDARELAQGNQNDRIDPGGSGARFDKEMPPENEPEARVRHLLAIASLRAHQSLFGAIGSPLERHVEREPFTLLQLTERVDPVIDVLRLESQGQPNQKPISPVAEALRGQTGESSILELLVSLVGEMGLSLVVTDFDREVDNEICRLLEADHADEPAIHRGQLESLLVWYGDYLTRLLALNTGITAFNEELRAWVSAWEMARVSRALPEQLRTAILNLILPVFNMHEAGGGYRLISLMSSRTEAVTSISDTPRLVVQLGAHPVVKAKALGDQLTVQVLDDSNNLLLDLVADFEFVRESMACEEWHLANTENSGSITPKIERFRTQLLRDPSVSGHLRLLSGSVLEQVRLI